ncbi:erythrocyte membrane protein 1, PfEMP1, putative [Plasmodium reichenowi]|uniref:Erythrocyte membrane protein 1, PfEMP1, putative n=1 Tax=Plasmodium reichenowi TaxID=5854 RepID=A0A2P9D9M8_PLARE|nr:erythrocyte membrane protein 1, PfEMP1, putative [Plasmodium reichenowi]
MGSNSGGEDAKHVLDQIGQQVHEQVKKEADRINYIEELKGDLKKAKGSDELASSLDPCVLIKDKGDKLLGAGNRYPCGNETGKEEDVKRFSKESGAECDDRKIKGNKDKGEGACAPFRRLSLCNKNFQNINNYGSNAKHDLLADVCMAAKYEGDSLTHYREQYDIQYPSSVSGSTMCTMLARSFADIGDILRGRDLYLGKKKKKQNEKETERDKLEKKLKDIFKEIHGGLTDKKDRYKDDEHNNYSKLREDWWTANRKTVWQALTCSEELHGNAYFHATCAEAGGSLSQANNQCRCPKSRNGMPNDQVPTYFDYVPQFLRWFEEWAEDFCRKKKKFIDILKTNCRGKYEGNNRYCSRNGYDCEQTVRARGKLRMGKGCTGCLYACNPYVEWIDNQKEQFEKQKKKYEEEIKKADGTNGASHSSRQKRGAPTNKYDGYEKKFYDELKKRNEYRTVNDFLDLLNKEKECQNITDKEGGTINFKNVNSVGKDASDTSGTNDINNGTFYRSKYCQPCPHCGVKKTKDENFQEKSPDEKCKRGKLYNIPDGTPKKDINVLSFGDKNQDIETNLKKFCAAEGTNYSDLTEEWKCYEGKNVKKVENQDGDDDDDDDDYENVKTGGGLCILKKKKEKKEKKTQSENNSSNEPDEIQKTFNDFFYYWVAHMLKDSIYWRTKELEKCLKNGSTIKCRDKCKNQCDCFTKWITQKKTEWGNIVEHFKMQKEIFEQTQCDPFTTLEGVLQKDVLLKSLQEGYGNAEEIKHIQELFQETGVDGVGVLPICVMGDTDSKKETTIDKLLQREESEAKDCLKKQEECENQKKQEEQSVARNLPPRKDPEEEEEEEESDDDSDSHKDGSSDTEETVADTTVDNVKPPCEIVKQLFEDTTNINEACSQKYGKNAPSSWKCITTTKPGPTGSSDEKGAICVPPRRRKLYIGPLSKWAESQNKGGNKEGSKTVDGSEGKGGSDGASEAGNSQETVTSVGEASSPNPTSGSENPLLEAFIQSAAIETFFLWHQYKQLNKTPQDETTIALGNHTSYDTNADNGPFFASTGAGMRTQTPSKDQLTSLQAQGQGGLQLYKPASLPTGPHPPSPFIPPGRSSIFGNSSGQDEEERTGELDNQLSNGGLTPLSPPTSDTSDDPQATLTRGTIPAPFLRQMFYTLADYKDILFSGSEGTTSDNKDTSSSNDNLKNIVLEAGGNKEEMEAMQKIQEKLKKFFEENGGDKPSSSDTSRSPSGKQSPSDTPASWWSDHAPSIWEAMICALTYTDNTDSEAMPMDGKTTLKQIENANNLWDEDGKKPKEDKYLYDQVRLKDDDSGTEPIPTHSSAASGGDSTINNPKLSDFVKIPTFFRYLHEWGTEFCLKRTEMLGKIKEECEVDEDGAKGKQKCSCYGEDCETIFSQKYDTVPSLECARCGKHCSFYRRWIKTKRTEFEEQSSSYEQQKTKCQAKSDKAERDNGFCGKLKTNYSTFASFLEKLKDGPCKNDINNGQGKKGEGNEKDILDFKQPNDTFRPATNCKPCSEFKVKCNGNDHCDKSKGTNCENKNSIEAKDIGNGGNSTKELGMRVSDNSRSGFEGDLKNACEHAGIFKSIKENKWECRNVCGYVVCKQEKGNGENKDQIITIRALVTHWVQYFLEDYNKIKKKLNSCKKKGGTSICTKNCAEAWINQKKKEWGDIKNLYKSQYHDDDMTSSVRNFLGEVQPQTELNKAIKPCSDLTKFQDSKDCNATETSGNANGQKKDVVECLLHKLETKIQTCTSSTSSDNQTACDNSPLSGNTPTPLVEDDDPLEEEEQNPEEARRKMMPSFCKDAIPEPKEDEVGGCEPAETPSETKKSDEVEEKVTEGPAGGDSTTPPLEPAAGEEPSKEKTEQDSKDSNPVPVLPAPKKPKEDKKKDQTKPNIVVPLLEHPLVILSLASSTLAWSVGIGFVALSYWFLKKKTKSSVDMLRVLQIPQNDYGMPTTKSSNRYIPYKSAQYRGKRYIYIEGDSSGDEKYAFMSDTTDITSSESEYEEFDINDIYAPSAPKYKTLIEVVLEPSKRDTQNDIPSDTQNNIPSGNTIPTSDNTIPTRGNTQPTSDTTNTPSDIPNTPSGNTIPNSGNTIPTSDIPNTPSDIQNNIPSDTHPPITDEEWNTLKDEFISNMLQSEQNDLPNDYRSGNIPTNTNNTTTSHDNVDNNTHPTMPRDNVDNNTHPTMIRDNVDEKPFIMSIHDRNLLSGEEYNYDMINNSGIYPSSSNRDTYSGKNVLYSGIDLINDSLNSGNQPIDIYDELLKRKENELFGTNHVKHTSTHSVAKNTRDDPINNQLNLFHKWLDRHRNMCEKWENHDERLSKLKEKWDNETHSGNIHPSDNKMLNTDVSIQINMNDPKPINQFTNMDTILEDLEKYDEPYYYDFHENDIYYDVNDDKTSVDHINMDYNKMDNNNSDIPTKVQIEMSIKNTQMMEEKYPIGDVWDI